MKFKINSFWFDNFKEQKIFCLIELGFYETDENYQYALTILNFRIAVIFNKKGEK